MLLLLSVLRRASVVVVVIGRGGGSGSVVVHCFCCSHCVFGLFVFCPGFVIFVFVLFFSMWQSSR